MPALIGALCSLIGALCSQSKDKETTDRPTDEAPMLLQFYRRKNVADNAM